MVRGPIPGGIRVSLQTTYGSSSVATARPAESSNRASRKIQATTVQWGLFLATAFALLVLGVLI